MIWYLFCGLLTCSLLIGQFSVVQPRDGNELLFLLFGLKQCSNSSEFEEGELKISLQISWGLIWSGLTVTYVYIYIVICKYIKTNVLIIHSKGIWKEIISAKIEKIGWQITMATLMQPLHYDFWCLAAKNNSFTHAAAPPSNLDAAITVRSAEIELQNTIECAQLQLQDRTSVPKQKKQFWSIF